MNNEFCCSKCADCTEVQSKWKSKQVVQWTSKITDYYNSQFSDKVQMKVYLDKGLLEFAVENAIIDLIRFMEFTKSQSADKHKYGGYFIKWIAKVKPVQFLENQVYSRDDEEVFKINELLAISFGFAMLGKPAVIPAVPIPFLENFSYNLRFRNVSGRILGQELYLCEYYSKMMFEFKRHYNTVKSLKNDKKFPDNRSFKTLYNSKLLKAIDKSALEAIPDGWNGN